MEATIRDSRKSLNFPDFMTTLKKYKVLGTDHRAAVGLILAMLVLVLVSQRGVDASGSQDARALGPPATSDLAVLDRGEGRLTFFAADLNSADLLYQDVNLTDSATSWDRTGFQKLVFEGPSAANPYALTARGSFLYVADKINEAIYEIDLEKRVSRLMLQKRDLSKPSSIAVSSEGLLAIGQDDNKILIYDTRTPGSKPRSLKGKFITPTRLLFDFVPKTNRSDLLAFDGGGEGRLVLYQASADKPDEYSSSTVDFSSEFKRRLSWSKKTTLDLAYNGETLFFINDQQWVAYSRKGTLRQLFASFNSSQLVSSISSSVIRRAFANLLSLTFGGVASGEDRWMVFPELSTLNPRRLVGLKGNLFALDATQDRVVRLPLKQVTVRLEVKPSEANLLLVDFYKTLSEASLLPARRTIVTEPGDLLTLLRNHELLTSAELPSTPTTPTEQTPADQMGEVICRLNNQVNGWQCPTSESATLLQRRLGQGQIVVVPGLGVQRTRYTGPYRLRPGETVETAVGRRMLDEKPRSGFSTEYLMRLNRIYLRTLEYEMTRRSYVLQIPSPSTSPMSGALVRFAGNDKIATPMIGCQTLWTGVDRIQSRPLPELSDAWRLHTPSLEYLPRTTTKVADESILNDWRKRGIAGIEMSFDKPVEEVIARETLTNPPASCWNDLQGKKSYLLWDRIRVNGVKYRLLHADGEPEILTAEDLARWGLAGTPGGPDRWSVRVEAPYVLAYRALPWDGKPLTTSELTKRTNGLPEYGLRVVDPGLVRPGSGQDIWSKTSADFALQDIWSKTNGELTLPGYRWELNLLVDAINNDLMQTIRRWIGKYPDKAFVWEAIDVSDRLSRPASLIEATGSPTAYDDLETVIANRKDLLQSISLPEGEKSDRITIGLVEDNKSIDQLHPDFAWKLVEDGNCAALKCFEYVWLIPTLDESNPFMRMRKPGDPDAVRTVRRNEEIDWENNHGTHIAGLLVSNGKVEGIIPDARIYWVRLGDADLSDQMTRAVDGETEIFNISQILHGSGFDWLESQIRLNLNDRLFVVAAGNTGATSLQAIDVNTSNDIPRSLLWVRLFPERMISVSAVDLHHKLLLNPDGSFRFNYGVKYVDMVAPGDNIYSSTRDGSYAPTSGTSQAVPLVTGTAALLYRKWVGAPDPSVIKARLLYTTDWDDDYLGKVWAGCLNADRALWGLDRDLFVHEFGDGTETRTRAINDESGAKLNIINWNTGAYKSDPARVNNEFRESIKESEKKIPFTQVLRLTRLSNGRYRIIYLDKPSNRLRIIMDASIQGTIKYGSFDEIKGKNPTHIESQTTLSLQLNKVIDFVGGVRRLLGAKVTF